MRDWWFDVLDWADAHQRCLWLITGIIALVLILLFTGACFGNDQEAPADGRFIVTDAGVVGVTTSWIIEDSKTGVQYLYIRHAAGEPLLVPLLDAAGKPYRRTQRRLDGCTTLPGPAETAAAQTRNV